MRSCDQRIDFMLPDHAVHALFDQYDSIKQAIGSSNPSELSALDAQYRKIAVLSCASYLEADTVHAFKAYFVAQGTALGEFVRIYAIERKFHTWFDWEKATPDKFFKSWGAVCLEDYKEKMLSDGDFDACMRSFMVLVSARNQLVHNNLAEVVSDLTFDEVRDHFARARHFAELAVEMVSAEGRPRDDASTGGAHHG